MASPPVIVLLFVTAVLLASSPRPTRSAASSDGAGALLEPTLMTFCSGRSTVTTVELATFLDAVCAGAYRTAAASISSHSKMSENRTMYGVAQCRPGVRATDCAACLASSSRAVIAAGATACAAAAIWRDSCFLGYSDGDQGGFREDEHRATVFRASRRALLSPSYDSKAAVTRLLAAARNRTMGSHMCRGAGGAVTTGTTAAGGRLMIHGLTRCAAAVSCADCRRCLRGALAVLERECNGCAGMHVLWLSCVASYGTFPLYKSMSRRLLRPLQATAANSKIVVTSHVHFYPPPATPYSPEQYAPRPPPPPPPSAGSVPLPSPPAFEEPPSVPLPSPPASAEPPSVPMASSPASAQPVHTRLVGHIPPSSPPMATPAPLGLPPHAETQHGSWWSRKRRLIITIIICIVIGVAVVVMVVILARIWFHRKHTVHTGHVAEDSRGGTMYHDRGEDCSSMDEEEQVEGGTTSCQLYSYQALEAATCQFSSSNKLGSGGFGTVYKGTFENGKEVAVKRLKDSKRSIQELERQISIEANLRHKNLLRFLGYCFQDEGRLLVYAYAPNNSLEKLWHRESTQSQKLEWATWFNIIKGVARGLRFLHDQGIIHRDLKPHNILLDENFNPKIADFDLIRVYDKDKTHESTQKIAGTFGYMAPECTSGGKFLVSVKSDVYSYGVLVLEIIVGHKINTFEGQNCGGLVEYVWQHWTEKRPGDAVDGSLLGLEEGQEHTLRQALRCVHVALLCVQADRSRRPTMGQVIVMLNGKEGAEEKLPEPSIPGYVSTATKRNMLNGCWLPLW